MKPRVLVEQRTGARLLVAGAIAALAACGAPRREAAPPPAVTPQRDAVVASAGTSAAAASPSAALEPIPLDGFKDGAKHYKNANNVAGYPIFRPDEALAIAENILLHQRDNGGWPPNWDPQRVLSAEERTALFAQKSAEDTSFDNRATYTQIDYLAEAYRRTGDARLRDACQRGLGYVFRAQYPHGGFPHSWPNAKEYRAHVTFMDDVMPGVLALLRKAASGAPPFDFLDSELRARAADALRRGDDCILKLQVMVRGERTIWAGQYDEHSLAPTTGRSYELPSLVSDESVSVVRYLMQAEPPTPEMVRAVEAAVAWFERSKLLGLRVERFAAEPVRYRHHTSTEDVRVVEDGSAPPLWGRFYEIDTNRPFMANRDGIKVFSLAEVDRERRTGYRWYVDSPRKLLERDYPAFRERQAARAKVHD